MQTIQNSAFKEKAAPVVDVSKILPEVGAVVLNKLDGRLYAADKFGWHRFGDPYSPINLFVDFNGTDQLLFRFKAPATSTLTIHEGDGTVTDVVGQDDTVVSHTTNYAEAGVYYFTVGGDVLDLTYINLWNQTMAAGDVSGWSRLTDLTYLRCNNTAVYGDVSGWSALTALTYLNCGNTRVSGDVSGWSALVSIDFLAIDGTDLSGDVSGWSALVLLRICYCYDTKVSGDVSGWSALVTAQTILCENSEISGDVSGWSVLPALTYVRLSETYVSGDVSGWFELGFTGGVYVDNTRVTFDAITAWLLDSQDMELQSINRNGASSEMVDFMISSFKDCTNCAINIAGKNAKRTAASDADKATLLANGNTLTVNE